MGRLSSAETPGMELRSPKDGDHFEATKPMLFWKAIPDAKSYEVDVDGAKAGEAPAGTGPVLGYALTGALAPGLHHWTVKVMTGEGGGVITGTSTFTIDAPANWPDWAIGPFVRYGGNPILSPQGTGWESVNAFNPGVLYDEGKYRMLYRAQGKRWPSAVGYAESQDGVTFVRNAKPLIAGTEAFEKKYGCEDARFFKYNGTYYTFYTGNSLKANRIALCEATSADGTTWRKLGPVVEDRKNGAVICDPSGTPVKINGKFALYTGNLELYYSDDMVQWSLGGKIDLKLPVGWNTAYEPCVAVTDPASSHPDDVVLFHRWDAERERKMVLRDL